MQGIGGRGQEAEAGVEALGGLIFGVGRQGPYPCNLSGLPCAQHGVFEEASPWLRRLGASLGLISATTGV